MPLNVEPSNDIIGNKYNKNSNQTYVTHRPKNNFRKNTT